ncbi:23S rRNA pseudouridine1911/1915/1917 synthase [Methylohalomonas lacus]|uniref:Pseudouridine synthase n=1 Tax=Methylohalomonas lacus TaxID=398773 RepID=A0AAE3HK83_9GAMM|nr:23S rRNA pseudouridine(1911/1915/1917) synthase RluD [Methylohalomonas lacus]MCS3903874.1 23S rRNA pseudouridine1911/1915/1917 synthase [Methylohalomonas lacus]
MNANESNNDTAPADGTICLDCTLPAELAGQRLDQALATVYREHSRVRISGWIRNAEVLVNDRPARPRDKVAGGEHIRIRAQLPAATSLEPEAIPLAIVHEDDAILVINKPPGLVVHPGAGNPRHTLMNALLGHDPALAKLPRAGIVQRLDKDTSGLMVIARTPTAHTRLVAELQARSIKRDYLAIVNGVLTAGGTVDAPIGRHPRQRTRMAVVTGGKPAVSHYRVVSRYRAHTLVRVSLESGRTHQIRVHMAHLNHAVLGDPLYGPRPKLPRGAAESLRSTIQGFRRQALHACALGLAHPCSGEPLQFEAAMPDDMQDLADRLAADTREHG